MQNFKYYLLFILLLSISLVTAGEILSLSQAIQTALKNNYSIQTVQISELIAEKNNSWGAAGALPSIDFSASATGKQVDATTNYDQLLASGSVTANWMIFDGFAVHIRKDQLEHYEKLSCGNTAAAVEQTIQAVMLSYYSVLLQQEKLSVLNTVRQLSRDRFDLAEASRELGVAVTYDVLQAKNAWLEDEARYLQQEAYTRNAIRDLAFLMAARENTDYELDTPFAAESKSYELGTLEHKMLADNTSLRNKFVLQAILKKNIALQNSNWWPSLSVRGGANQNHTETDYVASPLSTSESQDYFGTVSLNWNLFSGGSRSRARTIAHWDAQIGEIELDEMQHSLVNQLANELELYTVRGKLLNVADEALKTAQLNLDISTEKFRAGAINSFNYRDVQLIYLNAALSRLEAVYALIAADTELLRLTGGIVAFQN